MTLLELVREAYRNAVENGYDLTGCSVREIAYDMLECDAVIEVADASRKSRRQWSLLWERIVSKPPRLRRRAAAPQSASWIAV